VGSPFDAEAHLTCVEPSRRPKRDHGSDAIRSPHDTHEGTCVRHRFGKSSIKIYEKFGLVLRLETTTNDVSAFKHYRKRCYGASGEDKASSSLETTDGVPHAAAE
jgi:hypothetical protein